MGTCIASSEPCKKVMMGRPDYDDSITDGGTSQVPSTLPGDTTGWLQHGQDPADIEMRDR